MLNSRFDRPRGNNRDTATENDPRQPYSCLKKRHKARALFTLKFIRRNLAAFIIAVTLINILFPPFRGIAKITISAIFGKRNEVRVIRKIALLGEHNSGTTWTLDILQKCFGEKYHIMNHLTRHKHYFQFELKDGGKKDHRGQNNIIVVSQFRNPYDWVAAMMEKPRRFPAHRDMDWKTFVTTPWTTFREESDLKFANETGMVCKDHFHYDEIVSCNEFPDPTDYVTERGGKNVTKQPWYELNVDGSGKPYASVLDLRADKIRNHVWTVGNFSYVAEVVSVQYEELINNGTDFFIKKIEELTGHKADCKRSPPQIRPQREIDVKMVEWMNKYVDWGAEAIVGYKKRDVKRYITDSESEIPSIA